MHLPIIGVTEFEVVRRMWRLFRFIGVGYWLHGPVQHALREARHMKVFLVICIPVSCHQMKFIRYWMTFVGEEFFAQ